MNNKEDIEFLARMNAINSFKSSLRSLLKMYDFGVHESHNYGNNEEYVNTIHYFTINGECWYGDTIEDMLKDAINHLKNNPCHEKGKAK